VRTIGDSDEHGSGLGNFAWQGHRQTRVGTGFKTVKDFLVVITFLAMVLMPAFAALNVFSPKKNRF
jgi:hypothetical protein